MKPLNTNLAEEILSDNIDLPPTQMRRDIDREELYVLAENIKANGLISPITVRPVGDRYELVAGQRRLLAMRIAGIIRIPCIIRDLDNTTANNIMAAENLERRDVDVVDEGNFIARVMEESGDTIEKMATRLKRSEKYVADRILVGNMPDFMQAYLKSGELKLGAALLLMEIEPEAKRRLWVNLAVQNNETVRGVEYWVYQHKLGTLPDFINSESDVPNAPPPEYKAMMFTCSLDGKDYLATECRSIFIFKGNEYLLDALRAGLNSDPVELKEGGVENPKEPEASAP